MDFVFTQIQPRNTNAHHLNVHCDIYELSVPKPSTHRMRSVQVNIAFEFLAFGLNSFLSKDQSNK